MRVAKARLIKAALEAADNAYCPFSSFHVGAAVLVPGGQIYTGCNIENASYGLTVCAERTAIFKAISDGNRKIRAIAVACPDADSEAPAGYRMPCGACRQVMAEFLTPNGIVIVEGVGEFSLEGLLPSPFKL